MCFNPHFVENDLWSNILRCATECPGLAAKPNLLSKAKVHKFHIPRSVQQQVLRLERGEGGGAGESRDEEKRRWRGRRKRVVDGRERKKERRGERRDEKRIE